MKKIIIFTSILLFFLVLSYYLYSIWYVEFVPSTFDGEDYRRINVDARFYKNLEQVFSFYNIDYKVSEGKILVKRNVVKEEEMLFNYTSKALDSNWLKAHVK